MRGTLASAGQNVTLREARATAVAPVAPAWALHYGTPAMLGIPRRHGHFVFAVIQSGLTSLIAAAIASYPLFATGSFLWHWLISWLIAWATVLPIVVLAAPLIRSLSDWLTR